jgi:hypothetical protein
MGVSIKGNPRHGPAAAIASVPGRLTRARGARTMQSSGAETEDYAGRICRLTQGGTRQRAEPARDLALTAA